MIYKYKHKFTYEITGDSKYDSDVYSIIDPSTNKEIDKEHRPKLCGIVERELARR